MLSPEHYFVKHYCFYSVIGVHEQGNSRVCISTLPAVCIKLWPNTDTENAAKTLADTSQIQLLAAQIQKVNVGLV